MNLQGAEDKLKGNWNQLKGKLKENYGQLTDDDLTYIEGKKDQMIGAIQEKTGESKEKIAKFIEQNTNED